MKPELILTKPGEGLYEEKKSRFLALAIPVRNEEEAAAALNARRKLHPDARHHCYAYLCGPPHELTRSSDDGEPSGTGGRPILEALMGSGLHNAMVIVTRYFGGTLLGTGGLSRAYSAAALEALKNTGRALLFYGNLWQIFLSYSDFNKLERLLDGMDLARGQTLFEADISQEVYLMPEEEEAFFQALADATAGEAVAEKIKTVRYLRDGKTARPLDEGDDSRPISQAPDESV